MLFIKIAEADNLSGHIGNTRIVAVKTERANNGQGGLKAECEIMRKLGSHSNVVTLLGACVEQGKQKNCINISPAVRRMKNQILQSSSKF
jgi:hypothetical protein